VAEAEGYVLQFGCVSGPDAGAMGLHFVNGPPVSGGVLDATHPQIVIYEPTANGGLRLIGADYLLLQAAWDAKHSGPPELMGQLFHFFDAPNRFGLPAFYMLHVWAWKKNPTGAFRELAPQSFVRGIRRPKPLSRGFGRNQEWQPPARQQKRMSTRFKRRQVR
jgi:hypothetical protein